MCATALASCGGGGAGQPDPEAADPANAFAGRLVAGYQGWYGCPGDFEGNTEWLHWFIGTPAADHLAVDMLPDTDGLAPEDLCRTGLVRQDGKPLLLFSSQNRNVVDYHVRLMAQQAVGAIAVQRFVSEVAHASHKRRFDNVLRNVASAAERHGVPFFVSYDVTGAEEQTVIETILDDWKYLSTQLGVTNSAAYMRDHGKPVLQLWGFGFVGNPGAPEQVAALITELKRGAADSVGATLVGGVPTHWRTLSADSKSDPAWAAVYRAFDLISPWTVGRYCDVAEAESHYSRVVEEDLAEARRSGIRYLPVIFPGFSTYNLMKARGIVDPNLLDAIPRDCGRFLVGQAALVARQRIDTVYAAMFDELDEGTALLPAQRLQSGFPSGTDGVSLSDAQCEVPADWYVHVLGHIAEALPTLTQPSLP